VIAALVLAVALTQSDWESKQIGIAPSLARVETVGRRSVTWFEHDADPTWGGRAFRDSFAIASPVTGDRAGAPLLVVLHWRGGGMPGKGVDCQADAVDDKNRVFSAPDDFYVLMLDDIRDYNVLLGRTHDEYWWGATPNYAGPTVADVPRLLACETTCEKRVLDCVEWTIRRFGIERSRVYLCGNSMGGQAAEAIGLSHGEIFAAVNANVPATVWFAAARLGFVGPDGRDREDWSVERFADPPLLVDWSGVDDVWSRDREVVYRNVAKRKWAMIGLWGDYGHCGDVLDARARNDLVEKFDWLAVRKDEAYPAFTNAASDDRIPWPFSVWEPKSAWFGGWKGDITDAKMSVAEGARQCGQVNAFFRWRNIRDDDRGFSMELRVASAEELGTQHFSPPSQIMADVTVRRIQSPRLRAARRVKWRFGDSTGEAVRDEHGALTIPRLKISRAPLALDLL
jgi:pimeloyl-ACP methyl ester carboxylesterase